MWKDPEDQDCHSAEGGESLGHETMRLSQEEMSGRTTLITARSRGNTLARVCVRGCLLLFVVVVEKNLYK